MLRTLFVTVAFVAAISNALVLEDKINDFQFAEIEQKPSKKASAFV